METDPARTAETDLVALSDALNRPRTAECLFCFVDRMLGEFGCDGTLRWVRRWRGLVRPRAAGLERRMGTRGGFCDCEIFWNGWDLRSELQVPGEDGELEWPDVLPRCAGIGRRSTQPCAHWEPRRRF